MKIVEHEITKEEYEKAQSSSPYTLISDRIVMGYGVYGAMTLEKDGKYFLRYEMGDSCD